MNQRFLDQTYYEILEIEPDAPENEIHRAYLKAKDTYSPDSPALYTMFSPDEAQELSRLIEEAYSVLSNHAARREYDSRLLGRREETPMNIDNQVQLKSVNPIPLNKNSNYRAKTNYDEKVPEGYAKTKFGVYKIDKELETEISTFDGFDGEQLAIIRNYKNITIDDLSEDIRVSRPYLRAIEANDFKSLPADVFVRGFVLQYAKVLGLDADKVASSYMKNMRNVREK
ncbi:MAG: helix-turn-helix domain-containing protein [Bdellovibrionales bacterium]|nr:helix-turn-helix domain-containing protein [Bdellovibrionales bacterium]